jgi:hypothetical protein
MRRSLRIACVLAVTLLASPAARAATVLVVTSLGLTAPNANYGCPSASADCFTSLDFQLAGPANATGAITLNDAGTIAQISMDVASVTFATVPGGGPSAVFTNVHYQGAVTVFSSPGVISQLPAPGPGSVTGLLNGTPFTSSAEISNLVCTTSAGTGQCGVAFGPQSFAVNGQRWLNTFDVFVRVPEASALLLAALGALGGLALRRR